MSDKFGLTRTRKALSASDLATIDETFRKRIRSVQVLDQTVAELVQSLADQDALDNTYLIFTSDNGYIMGNHRREIGKYNQFQGTVNVPFYVRGPGITPGSTYDDVAGNIDIAPTIAEIAGARTPDVDGVSLLSRLHGGPPLARKYFLLGRALTPTNTTTANGLEEAPETYVESSRSSAAQRLHRRDERPLQADPLHAPPARGALRPQQGPVRARTTCSPTTTRRTPRCRRRAARRSTPCGRRWTG